MNSKLITVFTPTYNRKECLELCYESLKRQTSKNFVWLIIDDGSTDSTEKKVKEWQNEESDFEIEYAYKENGGLHTAYNLGIELAQTELFMCIDSDDEVPENAISLIEKRWEKIKCDGYVGIMGIDCYPDGKCVGDMFPSDIYEMYLYEKLTMYKISGDKKLIHQTELLKKVAPMPVFEGEKNFNPSYMFYQLDNFGKLYVTNECYCIVNYQPDGMSSNIFKQYLNSPLSFAETRKLYLSFPNTTWSFRIRHSIHYASSCLLAKQFLRKANENPYPILSWICLVPGMMLSLIIVIKQTIISKS